MARALAALVVVVTMARAAFADDRAGARAHYDKATAAYALGRYADAAPEFEQAFALKPDPAILYNAAQAYRLAGKRERALELYRSYLRVYGRRAEHAPDVEWHIADLERTGPPVDARAPNVEPASLTAPPPAAPVLAQPAPAPSALVVASSPPVNHDRPVYQRWWFWTAAGALVVGAIVGVALAARKAPDCGAGVTFCANTGL